MHTTWISWQPASSSFEQHDFNGCFKDYFYSFSSSHLCSMSWKMYFHQGTHFWNIMLLVPDGKKNNDKISFSLTCEKNYMCRWVVACWFCGVVVITSALHAEGPSSNLARTLCFMIPPSNSSVPFNVSKLYLILLTEVTFLPSQKRQNCKGL